MLPIDRRPTPRPILAHPRTLVNDEIRF